MQNKSKLKVFIMSYKKNGKWNETLSKVKKRFMNKGFSVTVVEGYYLPEHPEIKKTQLVYRNVLDKVIPKAKKYLKANISARGFFIAEDDAWLKDFVNSEYLKKKEKILKKKHITRVGFQKILKEPNLPKGYFCVGAQLTWIPANQLEKFEDLMKSSIPQHFNGFLSKTKMTVDILHKNTKKKLVDELEHMSFTMGKVRKGLKLTKKNKFKHI